MEKSCLIAPRWGMGRNNGGTVYIALVGKKTR